MAKDFNPHPREGGDVKAFIVSQSAFNISIHTPAKGVTDAGIFCVYDTDISIHTPAKGVTRSSVTVIVSPRFQSTPPRRG